MCHVKDVTYKPDWQNHEIYQLLYALYRQLHDAFGIAETKLPLANVMKELLAIKKRVK